MSERRDDGARAQEPTGFASWRDFVSSALLVGAVIAILVAGLLLKTDRPGPTADAAGAASLPPAALPLGSTITPEPAAPPPEDPAVAAGVPPPDPLLEALAARAAADTARLRTARGPWTAQLLVACKRDTVERAVASSRTSPKLYVLPAEVRGDACFRVCWGTYGSAKDAAAAADIPKALRGKEKIAAVEIAKVLP